MAIFLAAIATGDASLPSGLLGRMRDVLAPAGIVETVGQERAAMAYSDLGLWPGCSAARNDQKLAVVAGDPLICRDNRPYTREQSIAALLNLENSNGQGSLRQAEGTYCGIVFDTQQPRIVAFTDKLGVRPVYTARIGGLVFVSSVQWALEKLSDVPKHPDWIAATEMAAFGYPLGDKTLFKDIRVLGAGEVVTVEAESCRIDRYWDWTTIKATSQSRQDLTEHIRRSFNTAVDDRIQGQTSVLASLSGGMDSRLIVSRLREHDVKVHSLNYAPDGSLDLELGRLAAQVLGTDHFEFSDGSAQIADRLVQTLAAWRSSHSPSSWPQQPNLLWTGDGGSVGLGHVYLDDEIIRGARNTSLDAAAMLIQRNDKLRVSPHMFVTCRRDLADIPLQGIISDLRSRQNVEPGRNCHLFFVLNDQRRHLAAHYEAVHVKRVDVVLPFFDGRFLSAVIGSDVDPFLAHGLYNELMKTLPFGAGKTPWQAYPGHLPCPIHIPGNSRRQWEDGWMEPRIARRQERRRLLKSLGDILSSSFPSEILSRPRLAAACLAGLIGLRQYNYLIDAIAPYAYACRYGR